MRHDILELPAILLERAAFFHRAPYNLTEATQRALQQGGEGGRVEWCIKA